MLLQRGEAFLVRPQEGTLAHGGKWDEADNLLSRQGKRGKRSPLSEKVLPSSNCTFGCLTLYAVQKTFQKRDVTQDFHSKFYPVNIKDFLSFLFVLGMFTAAEVARMLPEKCVELVWAQNS